MTWHPCSTLLQEKQHTIIYVRYADKQNVSIDAFMFLLDKRNKAIALKHEIVRTLSSKLTTK
uniref:Uncharacterized protein n=1 Tax=Arundo donax TaxID=35708 RepID=A0A0A9TIH3_ARUDO